MHTPESLLDLHERCHRNLHDLLAHCGTLDAAELNRELPGFGYPTVRLQLHHAIGGEEYWIGVLNGIVRVDDNDADFPTIATLEAWRARVFAATESYLRAVAVETLNTARPHATWGGRTRTFAPAHAVLRTQTHLYHHQGQVVAMCRLLGKPSGGFDFPMW
ncbi:MAG: DinB family protein [bacterium]|nr:DinB family protein [bacterium]